MRTSRVSLRRAIQADPFLQQNQVIALERRPRELPFSYVRLLPKEAGVRPIVNLARRPLKLGVSAFFAQRFPKQLASIETDDAVLCESR